jgi:hypothetical protein
LTPGHTSDAKPYLPFKSASSLHLSNNYSVPPLCEALCWALRIKGPFTSRSQCRNKKRELITIIYVKLEKQRMA